MEIVLVVTVNALINFLENFVNADMIHAQKLTERFVE
jgi:hypothetical protein